MSTINVKTGEIAFAKAPDVIESSGIGSCVVVSVYDEKKKQGGLAHVMLPKKPVGKKLVIEGDEKSEPERPATYAGKAVDELVKKMTRMGSNPSSLEAKVMGGAVMFKVLQNNEHSLGAENVNSVKKALNSYGIEVISEDVGGNVGRSVAFSLNTGEVRLKKRL